MEQVSDPSDWKTTEAPFLSSLEESLRCHICKEYFTAPMITSCCHTFCSLCIRRQLDIDSRCPSCRKEIQLSALRKNAAIEETTELYKESRMKLLNLIQLNISRDELQNGPCVMSSTNKDEIESRQKEDDVIEDSEDSDGPPTKRLRSSQERSGPKDEYGNCPVCDEYMKIKEIEAKHIAGCLARKSTASSNTKAQFLRSPINDRVHCVQKLPSIAYSLMAERKLRDVIRDLGIPSRGDKQTLEKRHKEWINLWNANVDSKNQKSKGELLEELQSWERTIDLVGTASTDIKKIDTKVWNSTHSSNFKDLVAAARQSGKKKSALEGNMNHSEQETEHDTKHDI